jgi:hypothetical protein
VVEEKQSVLWSKPTQTISASQVNYAARMENELFILDNDDDYEDLLFRVLDNFDGAETDYPNANPHEVEQEGAFICYCFIFVCNIQFILPYSRRWQGQ